MSNPVTILGEELHDIAREERFVQELLEHIHEHESELQKEERAILYLNPIFRRLKDNIEQFRDSGYRQLVRFLSDLQTKKQTSYNPELDPVLTQYVRIRMDMRLVDRVISKIEEGLQRESKDDIRKTNKLLQLLHREQTRNHKLLEVVNDVFGYPREIEYPLHVSEDETMGSYVQNAVRGVRIEFCEQLHLPQ